MDTTLCQSVSRSEWTDRFGRDDDQSTAIIFAALILIWFWTFAGKRVAAPEHETNSSLI